MKILKVLQHPITQTILLLLLCVFYYYLTREATHLLAINAETGRMAWSRLLPNVETSTPRVAGERVMLWVSFEDDDGDIVRERLTAFERSGRPAWNYSTRGRVITWYPFYIFEEQSVAVLLEAIPKSDDEYSYEQDYFLTGLDLQEGEVLWRIPADLQYDQAVEVKFLPGQIGESFSLYVPFESAYKSPESPDENLVDGNLVDENPTSLRRYSLEDGTLQRTIELELETDAIYPPAFDAEGGVYLRGIGDGKDGVFKLDAETGEIIFKLAENLSDSESFYYAFQQGFNAVNPPSLLSETNSEAAKGTVYFNRRDTLSAIDTTTGDVRWEFVDSILGCEFQSPRVAVNIYLICDAGSIFNFDAIPAWLFAITSDGTVAWRRAMAREDYLAEGQVPALIEGGVAVIAQNGLTALGHDGEVRWVFPTPNAVSVESTSASSDGTLLYLTTKTQRWRQWLALLRGGY